MTTVYFNFPEIILGKGIDSSKEILLGDNRNTNIKVNDVNYTAYSVYVVGKDTDSNVPEYFVILCYSDANDTTSKCVYVVFPVTQTNTDKQSSDVDNIIDGKSDIKMELNKFIKDNGGCFITDLTASHITVTLTNQPIPIKLVVGKQFYSKSNLSEISIHLGKDTNAVLKKQDMDWIMTCDLLTEDGPTQKSKMDPPSASMTITMFFMTILITGCAYLAGPVVYTEFGMYKLAEKVLKGNHYSISVFWLITLSLLSFMCIIQGTVTNLPIYYFMGMALILSYFAAARGVLKLEGVHNMNGDGFATTARPIQVYSEIFFGSCNSLIGRIVKILIFIGLIGIFSGLVATMALKRIPEFTIHIVLFLFFSVLQIGSIYYFNEAVNVK